MPVFHTDSNKLLATDIAKTLMPNKASARGHNPSLGENTLLPFPQPHILIYSLLKISICVYQWQDNSNKQQICPRHYGNFK